MCEYSWTYCGYLFSDQDPSKQLVTSYGLLPTSGLMHIPVIWILIQNQRQIAGSGATEPQTHELSQGNHLRGWTLESTQDKRYSFAIPYSATCSFGIYKV